MDFNYRFLKGTVAVSLLLTFALIPVTPIFATPPDINSPASQPSQGKAINNENARSSHLLQLPSNSEDAGRPATGSITFVGNATVIIRYGALNNPY